MTVFETLITPRYRSINHVKVLGNLWSNCGQIVGCELDSKVCVVKAINVPSHINHPRITQSDFALNRKRQSYLVEYNWYRDYSQHLPHQAEAIICIDTIKKQQQFALVFADFKNTGFRQAKSHDEDINAIIKWLANFHAFNLNKQPGNLWHTGSYWHLDTRPDEWQKISDDKLKAHASAFDKKLKQSQYQTLIHGDAKLANFAFNKTTKKVRGYDFQYVGKGVGIIDLMYFLGSCLDEQQLCDKADVFLNNYFTHLESALNEFNHDINRDALISDWQALWPIAWADFYRFLAGWNPTHKKINAYMLKKYATSLEITG